MSTTRHALRRPRIDIQVRYEQGVGRRAGLDPDGRADRRYLDGLLNTWGWALGKTVSSPLARLSGPVALEPDALRMVARLAHRIVNDRTSCGPYDRAYVLGVRDALEWLLDEAQPQPSADDGT